MILNTKIERDSQEEISAGFVEMECLKAKLPRPGKSCRDQKQNYRGLGNLAGTKSKIAGT